MYESKVEVWYRTVGVGPSYMYFNKSTSSKCTGTRKKKNVLMIPLTLFTCKLTRADLISLGYCVITVLKSRGHQNMANLGSNPSSTIY